MLHIILYYSSQLLGVVQDIVDNKKLQMRGIVGLYAANALGDDIEVYTDDSRTEVLCRWASSAACQGWAVHARLLTASATVLLHNVI